MENSKLDASETVLRRKLTALNAYMRKGEGSQINISLYFKKWGNKYKLNSRYGEERTKRDQVYEIFKKGK